jgi:spore germination protein
MMVLTGFATSSANEIEVTHNIVINQELQDYMINGLLSVLKSKKYYGINLTNTYVLAEDRILYVEYIRRLSTRLNEEGYKLFLTLTRSAFEILTNVTYEDLRYDILGQLADNVAIITYEWGFSYGLPPTIVAFETINEIILYGKSLIQADKLNFGYSTIGYIWRLPYIDGATIAQSITYNSAINLAREHSATIYFDDTTKASYFQFLSSDEYIVRFRDVRGINSILQLVPHYGAEGVSVWMYNSNNMNINSARCEKAPSTILWTSTQYRSI